MGIFDKIKDALWRSKEPEEPATPKPQVNPAPTRTASADSVAPTPTASSAPAQPTAGSTPAPTSSSAPSAPPPLAPTTSSAPTSSSSEPAASNSAPTQPGGTVDVAAIMDAAVKKKGQKLDWRHSIVDMMKALDLDSDLASRRELAEELNYTGDKQDSAKMNVWLHKALMQKLAENGGKVPAELTD